MPRTGQARKHPLRVDRAKRRQDRGRYHNPEAFDEPRSAGVGYQPFPKRITRRELRRSVRRG
jgi:hypothetical protein